MAFSRVVPHSDGAGVIDQVGDGVEPDRVGQRVWVWGAQSYRPMGTAAELTVVPADRAVVLPERRCPASETGGRRRRRLARHPPCR